MLNSNSICRQDTLVYRSLVNSLPDDIILKSSIQSLKKLFITLKATPVQISKIKGRRRLLQSRKHTIDSRTRARKVIAILKETKKKLLEEKDKLNQEIFDYKKISQTNSN